MWATKHVLLGIVLFSIPQLLWLAVVNWADVQTRGAIFGFILTGIIGVALLAFMLFIAFIGPLDD
jgi:hypothetical protein